MKLSISTHIQEWLKDLLFPKVCRFCGDSFQSGLSNILCRPCFHSISPYEDPVCEHCGISLPARSFEDAVNTRCLDCGEEAYFLDRVRAVGPYEGALRIVHHGFKFEGMEGLSGDIAHTMAQAAIPSFWNEVKLLVPVPLSAERERERGYNPSGLLAADISKSMGIPFGSVIKKIRVTKPQMSLSREQRLKNPKDVYRLKKAFPLPSKVILVDDVFTTGATLEECAKVLKKAGVVWVGAIVFGRTPLHFQ